MRKEPEGDVPRDGDSGAPTGWVERILTAKRAAPDADTTALEREIDERVHRPYGLTADEIKLVEEGTS